MGSATPLPQRAHDPETRLKAFGLTTSIIHDSFKPGLSHARNRSSLATRSAAGSDIYQDSFEQLALRLTRLGWTRIEPQGQPRLLHPQSLIAVTVSSATRVANPDPRVRPRTGPKGPATGTALDRKFTGLVPLDLEEFEEKEKVGAATAPLWFILCERTDAGLNLSLARPAGSNAGRCVVDWSEEIPIASLKNDDDLSMFEDDGDDSDGFNVEVIPIS